MVVRTWKTAFFPPEAKIPRNTDNSGSETLFLEALSIFHPILAENACFVSKLVFFLFRQFTGDKPMRKLASRHNFNVAV